jgi:hypothetical protein
MRVVIALTSLTLAGVGLAVELELSWDNGTPSYAVNGPGTLAATWYGNHFDVVGTLKTSYVSLRRFRIYTTNEWPNSQWEGFRLGVYSFYGGVPGTMIWPTAGGGAFFKPKGTGWNWYEYSLDFPLKETAFLAAAEAIYNWPACDPLMADTNRTPRRHSWAYYEGAWAHLNGPYGYSNLMLRVVVETEAAYPAVAPSSWGRIKGLYY